MLVENTNFSSYGYDSTANASALEIRDSATATLTHTVFRGNLFGNGALNNKSSTASLTTNGCLTFAGNAPVNVRGNWTDNSAGPCTGTIGNGDDTVVLPQVSSCGLPLSGILVESAGYSLTADCQLTGNLILSEGITVVIDGNGRRVSGPPARSCCLYFITAGNSRLELNNLYVDRVRFINFGVTDAERIVASGVDRAMFFDMGTSNFRNAHFEDIQTVATERTSVLLTYNIYNGGVASFTNAIFQNNHSAQSVLWNVNGSLTLNGCITFEGNTPADTAGAITDNRSGACTSIRGPTIVPNVTNSTAGELPMNCFQRLGAIGLICRVTKESGLQVEVWGGDSG